MATQPTGPRRPTPSPRLLMIGMLIAVGAGTLIVWYQKQRDAATPGASVTVPTLTALAQQGRTAFDKNCAVCHGANAAGSNKGPPLVHQVYEPNHHADMAFQRAISQGASAHHWQFGDMPAQPQVSPEDTAAILRYVRELQKANGIF